jgi:predicted short-subunit dehydrogenase-like oxidoreductase (DUF2520 family)
MRELERDLPTEAAPAAGAPQFSRLAVIGSGRAGRSIATAATAAGLVVRLAGRSDALEACRDSDVALLCVPDDEIAMACATAAAAVPPLRFVGHTSGATTLHALSAAAEAGAQVFSLHPLQTIPDARADLVGAPCAVAGSTPDALGLARDLAHQLQMRPFDVPEDRRDAYHAAAAMASNLLVALEECAADVMDRAGVDSPGRELLAPLVLRSAANWVEHGPDALTGPIARGDEATVERHLEALQAVAPELVPVYESLAERARALAAQPEART